jgi:hypothetical protein
MLRKEREPNKEEGERSGLFLFLTGDVSIYEKFDVLHG